MPIRIHIMLTRSLLVGNRVWNQSFLWCPELWLRNEMSKTNISFKKKKLIFQIKPSVQIRWNICETFVKTLRISSKFEPGLCRTFVQTHSNDDDMNRSRNRGECWTIEKRSRCNQCRCLSVLLGFSRASPVKLHGSLISIWCTINAGDESSFYASEHFFEQCVVCDWKSFHLILGRFVLTFQNDSLKVKNKQVKISERKNIWIWKSAK